MRWLVLLIGVIAGSAQAQTDTQEAASRALTALQEATDQLDIAQSRDDRVAALTEGVQAYEAGLAAVRAGLRDVALRRMDLNTHIAPQREQTSDLMGVLMQMQRTPAPLLQLHPSGPLGTARAALFLDGVRQEAQAEVDAVSAELVELDRLTELQQRAVQVLEQGLTRARDARLTLATAISERQDLPRRFREDPVQTAILMASTETLDAFANNIADMVDTELGGTVPNARDLQGQLPLPVAGEVSVAYRAADGSGAVRPGWIIAAPTGALVTTPVAATLRFQGSLLEYGTVVILEPSPDVLIILTGMTEAYGVPGQILPAGAPVGAMVADRRSIDDIVSQIMSGEAGQTTHPLYLEVRDGQSAVDPAVWFDDTQR